MNVFISFARLLQVGLLGLSAPFGASAVVFDTLSLREAHAVTVRREVRSGAPIWMLDSAALQTRGVVTTADALRRLPGVNLRDYGGAGGLKTVSVRGLGASHTVVTHDGLPVGDARMGQIDFRRFPLHRLQAMSLSVADAPELLVPVRALGAATVWLQSKSGGNVVGFQAGSWGMAAPFVAWSYKSGRSVFGASADYYRGANDYPFVLTNGTLRTRERRDHSEMHNASGELTHHYTDGATDVSSRVRYQRDRQQLPGPVTYYTKVGTERLADQDAVAQSTLRRRTSWGRLLLAAKYTWQERKYTNRDGQFPGGLLEQFYWQRESYVTLGAQRDWGAQWQMAYAADYTHAALNSNLRVDNRVRRHSLQQALSLRHRRGLWTATARLSLHQHWNRVRVTSDVAPLFGQEEPPSAEDAVRLTPSLALSRQLLQTAAVVLSANAYYQEMFRMPTFSETYYYHYGNRRLRPELTRQMGVGLSGRWTPEGWSGAAIGFSVDAYHNRVSDRIVAIPLSPHVWRAMNMSRVRSLGIDATLGMETFLAKGHRLSVGGHYSYQKVGERSNPSSTTYNLQLPYTPHHAGSLSLSWDNPWLLLVLSGTAASSRWATHDHAPTTELPPYAEWGLSLSRAFRLGKHRLDARLDVTNLTNRQYEILRRYPMPGRAWRTSLIYTF